MVGDIIMDNKNLLEASASEIVSKSSSSRRSKAGDIKAVWTNSDLIKQYLTNKSKKGNTFQSGLKDIVMYFKSNSGSGDKEYFQEVLLIDFDKAVASVLSEEVKSNKDIEDILDVKLTDDVIKRIADRVAGDSTDVEVFCSCPDFSFSCAKNASKDGFLLRQSYRLPGAQKSISFVANYKPVANDKHGAGKKQNGDNRKTRKQANGVCKHLIRILGDKRILFYNIYNSLSKFAKDKTLRELRK